MPAYLKKKGRLVLGQVVVIVSMALIGLIMVPDMRSQLGLSFAYDEQCGYDDNFKCCTVGGYAGNCYEGTCNLCPASAEGYIQGCGGGEDKAIEKMRENFKEKVKNFDCKLCFVGMSKLYGDEFKGEVKCWLRLPYGRCCKARYMISCTAKCYK